jgi:hypothetical protein
MQTSITGVTVKERHYGHKANLAKSIIVRFGDEISAPECNGGPPRGKQPTTLGYSLVIGFRQIPIGNTKEWLRQGKQLMRRREYEDDCTH